ncbi:protein of unknown function zinc metallopeptidase putative [Beutenbergia cavernae DSM 12333]|uniref:Neutral zinc metallopeptidase n=1 Tax=Beutenbergia cavernae (strain ATCC BAA-8 / DSM 12333 / CCUG 43141 / JCM 11478 / NBRC 16432 / NCIMB 13614 / HKI 0122) TaxID=471853 RepID=C5BVY1_BEUC1|nr:neutral zinc metallopeptidase [Beutenbergia cavernae]ACQ80582.1 protein of unknown function zinc metallopeptidase putative [Beutenbergia cavernae DSM 12333]
MTFNENANVSGSRVRRGGRGRGAAIGGGVGGLLVVVLGLVFGFDLGGLAPGDGGEPVAGDEPTSLEDCRTGADANENVECRMQATALSLDAYWEAQLPTQGGVAYDQPPFELFTAQTTTACGAASSATGPFYCPPDATVYLDVAFFDQLTSRFGASNGSLAQMYVVAHEFGHHIQNRLGTMDSIDRSGTGPTSDGVRLELQADCYAGMWVRGAATTRDDSGVTFLEPPTRQQIADALSAAAAVGDDRIQSAAGGAVNPEAWTHGSSESRQRWFGVGYDQGSLAACDTFAVSGSQL